MKEQLGVLGSLDVMLKPLVVQKCACDEIRTHNMVVQFKALRDVSLTNVLRTLAMHSPIL